MELSTGSQLVDSQRDALYRIDTAAHAAASDKKPWAKDPNYFKTVRISAVAMVKMVMHARSGGSLEVMGLMQGYVQGTALVVTDAFRLPVEGTETRVNAQDEANEYLVEYLQRCRDEGSRMENPIGWYHSHPGYGCWLSGIDVSTQHLQQQFSDPFVAVVIDPDRTVSASKVEIGAFRTYPEHYKPGDSGGGGGDRDVAPDGYQAVPLNKAEDFGAHSSRYYSLEVEHFKSTLDTRLLDLLWNKYWVQTLAQDPLLTNREFGSKQMTDLAHKAKEATAAVTRSSRSASALGLASRPVDRSMDKVVRDAKQIAAKERAGLMAAEVKGKIFGGGGGGPSQPGSG